MGQSRFSYLLHQERSDEQLLDDALKRAFPPVKSGEDRFKELLDRLRDAEEEGEGPEEA